VARSDVSRAHRVHPSALTLPSWVQRSGERCAIGFDRPPILDDLEAITARAT